MTSVAEEEAIKRLSQSSPSKVMSRRAKSVSYVSKYVFLHFLFYKRILTSARRVAKNIFLLRCHLIKSTKKQISDQLSGADSSSYAYGASPLARYQC